MADPNLDLLVAKVRAMGQRSEQVVFVGGCSTGLVIDNAALMDVRPTEDVNAIVEVASLVTFHCLAELADVLRLRHLSALHFWQPSSKPPKTVAKMMCASAITLKTS